MKCLVRVRRRTVSAGPKTDHCRSMGSENEQASTGHIETALHPGGSDRRGGRTAHRQRGRRAAQIREDNDRHRSSRYR